MKSCRKRPAINTKKTVISTLGAQSLRTLLTLVTGPILSRLIGPAAYGVLAPAQSVGLLGQLIAESGLAYHTITAKNLSAGNAVDLHRQSLRLAGLVAAVAGFLAMIVGHVPFWEREFRGAFAVLSVILAGVAAIPTAWAQRHGSLARLEWFGFASQAATTFAICIPAAYFFKTGLMAAGGNIALPTFFMAIIAWNVSGLRRTPPLREIVDGRYRWGNLGSNIGAYLANNVDTLVLSTYLANAPLGVYSRANLLASLPGNVVALALGRIGLVRLSKSESWEDHLRFLRKASLLSFAGFFALGALSLTGLNLTYIAFGPKFSTPNTAFALLVASQVFLYAGSILNTYLRVRRKLAVVTFSMTLQAAGAAALFLVFRPTSIMGISWVLLIPAGIRYAYAVVYIWIIRTQLTVDKSAGPVEGTQS